MSCCGRGTTTPGGAFSDALDRLNGRDSTRAGRAPQAVYFQYTGPTQLIAVGPFSGRSYRFATAGAVLPVDSRDRRSLECVPHLRLLAAQE